MTVAVSDPVAAHASSRPEAIALEETATGRLLSYGVLHDRVGRAASLLLSLGVGRGDRVAILCRNRVAFFEILFACARIGAILVPLNWRMPAPELDDLVALVDPCLLIFGDEDADVPARLSRQMPALALDRDYESRLLAEEPHASGPSWRGDDIWYLLTTSGTTGRPKAVSCTYRMAWANVVNLEEAIGIGPGDTTLNYLPLFHTAGINLHTLPTLFAGGRAIILPDADIDGILAMLAERRVDIFFGVPTIYQALLDHPRFASLPLDHVRHWASGGAALPDAVAERFRELGLRLCNGMGMTETGPTAFMMPQEDAWDRIGSVGKAMRLVSVRIVDACDRDLPDGETGDLLFGGPGVTPGYWRDPAATAEALTPDGWLRSGDLARRDSDGFYFIVGRRKEMYISGGENVFPVEVETVLSRHPDVAEAAVIAMNDPYWGEVGHAFLRLAAGGAAPDAAAMEAFCRSRLAAYKVPRRFTFVNDFPRAASGKIQKRLLAR